MKERILQCFNKSAETYDAFAGLQLEVAKRLAKRIVYQPEIQTILEIGCGTGILTQQLLPIFPFVNWQLTDIAPAMVALCQQRFAHYPKLTVSCMDGEALTSDVSFDLIISSMTMQWFTQLNTSLAALKKKLTSSGRLIFAMLGQNSLHEWRMLCEKWALPIATPSFPHPLQLQKDFPEIEIETETIVYHYSTCYEFLMTLKKIGATATHSHYKLMSASVLRNFLRNFKQEMSVSYEIIYGYYVQP